MLLRNKETYSKRWIRWQATNVETGVRILEDKFQFFGKTLIRRHLESKKNKINSQNIEINNYSSFYDFSIFKVLLKYE